VPIRINVIWNVKTYVLPYPKFKTFLNLKKKTEYKKNTLYFKI